MAQRTQLELYGLFQTGLAPTQQNFGDLIDTVFAGDAATMSAANAAVATANAAAAIVNALPFKAAASFTFVGNAASGDVTFVSRMNVASITWKRSGHYTYTFTVTFATPLATANYGLLSNGSSNFFGSSVTLTSSTTDGFTFTVQSNDKLSNGSVSFLIL